MDIEMEIGDNENEKKKRKVSRRVGYVNFSRQISRISICTFQYLCYYLIFLDITFVGFSHEYL